MRNDFAIISLKIFGVSFIFYIILSHLLALFFELIIYTFILKRENVSFKLRIPLLYKICRQGTIHKETCIPYLNKFIS